MEDAINVVIVDDDIVERQELLRTLSSSEGIYNIFEAQSASELFSHLDNNKTDIILLDYRLPDINGLDIISRLKESYLKHKMAIIMVSRYSDETLISEAINTGAHDFILKDDISISLLKKSIIQSRKRQELEEKLYKSYSKVKNLAERDSLTGLYNRYYFNKALSEKLSTSSAGKMTSVMLLDLDKFKYINDTFGHSTGDKLLIEVSQRLRTVFRNNELFARLGGDEFAFICENLTSIQQAIDIGHRLLEALNVPVNIDNHTIVPEGSIGIAIHPINGTDFNELMKYADIAMYRAKEKSGKRVCVFKDNMQKEMLHKLHIEEKLRNASLKNDFSIQYQPIVRNNRIEGLEALMRWSENKTSFMPSDFIPIAEETGIINKLNSWLIEQSIADIEPIIKSQNIYLSINISHAQLSQPDFAKSVAKIIERHSISAKNIVFEVKESALLKNNPGIKKTISNLSDQGFRIAFDDFGSGYSSVHHLLEYPFSIIKLSCSLISSDHKLMQQKDNKLKRITDILKNTSLEIIAKGIESEAQAQYCNQINLKTQQGYYYSKPVWLFELAELFDMKNKEYP